MRAYWIASAWPDAECTKTPTTLKGVDVLVVQQKVMYESTAELIGMARERGIKVFADVCDPLWMFLPAGVAIIEAVDLAVCSTSALAADIQRSFGKPAVCIPDYQKIDEFGVKEHGPTEKPVLMWHGTYLNRAALWNCAVELGRLHAMGIAHKIVIVDNRPDEVPYMLGLAGPPDLECVPWDLSNFYGEVLPQADVGLVPRFPGTWGGFKSDNKRDAFHVAGVPTTTGDDIGVLVALVQDWQLRQRMGKQAREKALELCGIEHGVEQWQRLIKAVCS